MHGNKLKKQNRELVQIYRNEEMINWLIFDLSFGSFQLI